MSNKKWAYYNEFDPKAAAWLRELIKRGLITNGVVDERSISDVRATDVAGFLRVHMFAGIAGWDLALQLAGWPADKPVWTGSCPCQAFSSAGKGGGTGDHRDLWPVFANLIRECRPAIVFGEQVEAAVGFGWLDRVYRDLEAEDYAVGSAVLGAHSVNAPHIRQRLYWGAENLDNAASSRHHGPVGDAKEYPRDETRMRMPAAGCEAGGLADPEGAGSMRAAGTIYGTAERPSGDNLPECCGTGEVSGGLADTASGGLREHGRAPGRAGHADQREPVGWLADAAGGQCQQSVWAQGNELQRPAEYNASSGLADLPNDGHPAADGLREAAEPSEQAGAVGIRQSAGGGDANPWADAIWWPCRDGKYRRIPAESAFLGMADGLPCRVDIGRPESGFPLAPKQEGAAVLLKGYGNAIVPQVAATFVLAF